MSTIPTHISTKKTLYDTLEISSESATAGEIKTAFRKLALQHHPDKRQQHHQQYQKNEQSSISDNVNVCNKINHPRQAESIRRTTATTIIDNDVDQDEEFRVIRHAYNVLRNDELRNEYDDELNRVRNREMDSRAMLDDGGACSSPIVSLDEMTCEIATVVDDDEDEADTSANDDVEELTEIVFTHPCRCGDVFEILESDIIYQSTENGKVCTHKMFPLECCSCSLSIRVDYSDWNKRQNMSRQSTSHVV